MDDDRQIGPRAGHSAQRRAGAVRGGFPVKRGRPRQFNPAIPEHIDQTKIPTGLYWHPRDGYWYTFVEVGNHKRSKRLAGPKASLADLHQLMEDLADGNRGSIEWLHVQFETSDVWKALSPATQSDYRYCLGTLKTIKARSGTYVSEMIVDRLSRVLVQKLVNRIASTHPSKAAHVLRYLRRLLTWGMQDGYCTERENPAAKVRAPREKRAPTIPDKVTMRRFIEFLQRRGAMPSRRKGSVVPYLWALTEIAYRCRLRGIEVVHLTDDQALEAGIQTERRKGSRDNVVKWCPELREAWAALHARRAEVWERKESAAVIPLRPERRALVVAEDGKPLTQSALKSAWDRAIRQALEAKVIEQRFGLHAMKHRGISDTKGTRDVKQQASGHKAQHMLDTYDHDLPLVEPAGTEGGDF